MTKFKVGDRVFVPKGAKASYGAVYQTGAGVIHSLEDCDGDVRVRFDENGHTRCALAKDVKREKVFAQPGDVSVGDKVRVKITYGNGDKSKHDFVVTCVNEAYIHSTDGLVSWYPNGGTQTIEILEKAPVPEPEPLKVGDRVSGKQYGYLPVGTLVDEDGRGSNTLFHTPRGWINQGGWVNGTPTDVRTIVWLPA